MKKIGLLMILGATSLVWGAGEVTIQVINAVKESSITPDFDQKLKKSGLGVHKVVEGGRYIVTLGTYKDEKAAQAALKKARTVVCKEAFVRLVNRDQVASASHEAKKAVAAAPNETKKTAEAAHAAVSTAAAASESKAAPVSESVVHVDVKPIVVEVKNEPVVIALSSFEKKELYKSEIAEAINYYKHSPYHRFEPVMLQR